jgi:hypothetical protein
MNSRTEGNVSRLSGRLLVFVWAALLLGATGAKAAPVQTLVQDTLYRADGQVAQGMLTIRWNAFSTSAGQAVPAGEMTVTTNASGGITIPLIANTGSSPSGSYYRVYLKLDDGTTSEEQWVVPAVSTTTIAAIRATVVPQAVAAQFVSRDYVDTALAAVAPGTLVHLTGTETISGAKSFTVSPEVPAPTDAGGAADKGYVDQQFAGLATVATTGNYNDLANKPTGANLSAPGAIGTSNPGTVNATAYSVNGVPLSSANLSDASALVRTSQANTFSQPQTMAGTLIGTAGNFSGSVAVGTTTPTTISPTAGVSTPAVNQQGANPALILPGSPYGTNYGTQNFLSTKWTQPNSTQGMNNTLQTIDSYALAGGFNANENGYTNKTNWTNLYLHRWDNTPGQHMGLNAQLNCYSNGDCISVSASVTGYGGTINGSDEGLEAYGAAVSQGGIAYQGTIASGATTGSTSIAVTPIQGAGTQGEGRHLIDLTQGFGAGVITAIAGSGPTVFTGSGTSWAVSTETTLSAAIGVTPPATAPGSVTATVASTSGMTTSSLVCVADAGNFETVYPSAVNSGTAFTASFRKSHANGAFVAWGGLCGSYIAMTKDTWTTGGTFGYTGVTAPLRQIWPVIGSTSATSAQVWITAAAVWDSYQGQARTASEAYTLYPGAETTGVASSGTVDNTFILAPNNVAWVASDSVEQSLGASLKVSFSNTQITRFFPAPGNGGGGSGTNYNGIWTAADTLMYWRNNTSPATYVSGGGALTPPIALRVFGVSNVGLQFDYAPDSALFTVKCPNVGCAHNGNVNVLQIKNNAGGYDYIQYNPSNGQWGFTAQNYTQQFSFPTSGSGTLLVSGATPTLSGSNNYTGSETHTGSEVFQYLTVGNSSSPGQFYLTNGSGTNVASMYGGQAAPLVIPGIMYGIVASGNYTTVTPSASSSIAVSLPAVAGTLAVTGQVPTASSWPNAGACTTGQFVNGLTNGSAPTCSTPSVGAASSISGGAANQLVIQTGSGATGFVTNAAGVLQSTGSAAPAFTMTPTQLTSAQIGASTNGVIISALGTGDMWIDTSNASSNTTVNLNLRARGTGGSIILRSPLKDDSGGPTVSSCGTSPSIVGGQSGGHVTGGTGATGCTVAFAGSPNGCVVSFRSGTPSPYSLSGTSLTIATSPALGTGTFDYFCTQN